MHERMVSKPGGVGRLAPPFLEPLMRRHMKTIDKLYLIPVLGLVICLVWAVFDLRYVNNEMNPKVLYYGGLICHILIGEILIILLL